MSSELVNVAPGGNPVSVRERILEMDVVRGLTLFGILTINWRSPTFGDFIVREGVKADYLIRSLVEHFIHQRCYPVFSALFGLGFFLQFVGATSSGRTNFATTYLRRLGALFCIGAAHRIFLWQGDILHFYAITGLCLFGLRKWSSRSLTGLALVFIAAPVFVGLVSPEVLAKPPVPGGTGLIGLVVGGVGAPSYAELVFGRLHDWGVRSGYARTWLNGLDVLGLMMLGLVFGKAIHAGDTRCKSRRWLIWGSIVAAGLGLSVDVWDSLAGGMAGTAASRPEPQDFLARLADLDWVRGVVRAWTKPLLGFAYAGLVVLLLKSPKGRRVLSPLAAVGRMALTNYLLISLFGVWIYFGQGLGLRGRVPWSWGIAGVGAFFIAQILWSGFWLKRYDFGPVEWVWRMITYGKTLRMRKQS